MKGSVRKRGSTWYYSFEMGTIGGKRQRQGTGGFRTKAIAELALAQAITEYENCGESIKPSEISFADFCDYWLLNVAKKEMRPQSYAVIEGNIRRHIKSELGKYKLKALTPAVLQKWANNLPALNLAAQTNKSIMGALGQILKYARHPMEYIKSYPLEFVKLPRQAIVEQPVQLISDENYSKLLKALPPKNQRRISIVIAYNTGYRRSESCGLDWSEIDFVKKVIHLKKQILLTNGQRIIGKLKTPTSIRDTLFGNVLAGELKTQRQWQLENRMLYGAHYIQTYKANVGDNVIIKQQPISQPTPAGWERIDFVNTKENGELYTSKAIQASIMKVVAKIGIDFHFHMLRHTHATKLIEGGASIKAIQNRLGHSNLTTTANTYLHKTQKMDVDAVEIFDACQQL